MKIALIDDDKSYCRMLRLWIAPEFHHDVIYEFHSRNELEEHLGELDDLDVAIVDRNVSSENDGIEIAEEVKEVCHCLVVGLSAYSGRRYGDKYLSKGDYQKVADLIEEIRKERNAA